MPIPPMMYYTTARDHLRPYMPTIPVMISAASCIRIRRNGSVALLPPRLPAHLTELAADCGGYAAAMRWHGHYPFSLRQYIRWLTLWPIKPAWAAIPDLPCVAPEKGRKYPGREVVRARQRFTTEMAREVWHTAYLCQWSWCPTIQGFYPEEYAEHALELRDLIMEMYAASLEPACYDDLEEAGDAAPQPFVSESVRCVVHRQPWCVRLYARCKP